MDELKFDVVVIGGGPGGTPGAMMLAKSGLKVALIEKGKGLGGTCLFDGCIPSKIFIETANRLDLFNKADRFAIKMADNKADVVFTDIIKRKDSILKKRYLRADKMAQMNGLNIFYGKAQILNENKVQVKTKEKDIELKYDKLIIATGSEPVKPSLPGSDLPGVLYSHDIFQLERKPESITIVGGGYIGVEIASMLARMGTEVKIIEALPDILSTEDQIIRQKIKEGLESVGVKIYTESRVSEIKKENDLLRVKFEKGTNIQELSSEKVLIAVGRKARTEELNLNLLGIQVGKKGEIAVNSQMQTKNNDVYAPGDVNGQLMLAHVATRESTIAARNILGQKAAMSYAAVPHAIFSEPEAASVGLTSSKAREEGYKVIDFSYTEDARALIVDDEEGLVQMIVDPDTHQLLGMQIVGKEAGELIIEATQIIRIKGKVEDILATIHPHPTLSEVIFEAAQKAIAMI